MTKMETIENLPNLSKSFFEYNSRKSSENSQSPHHHKRKRRYKTCSPKCRSKYSTKNFFEKVINIKTKFHISNKFDEKHCEKFLKDKMKCLKEMFLSDEIKKEKIYEGENENNCIENKQLSFSSLVVNLNESNSNKKKKHKASQKALVENIIRGKNSVKKGNDIDATPKFGGLRPMKFSA